VARVQIVTKTELVPMPVVLLATVTDGRPNVMAAAWVTQVNSEPPMVAISLGRKQHTNRGVKQTGEFTINVPGTQLVEKVDLCGLVSGRDVDKGSQFELVRGVLEHAPMLAECALGFECRVTQTLELPTDTMFLAEVVAVHADEGVLTEGSLDVGKLRPFTLVMPESTYRELGPVAARAWDAGRALAERLRGR
jgi:flavin reductase (DIM6/NTAB) family NADH-FMN oxidoreductase RutF